MSEAEAVHRARLFDVAENHIDGELRLLQHDDRLVGIGRLYDFVPAVPQVLRNDEAKQNFVFDDKNGSRARPGRAGRRAWQ
jgi:hypothetical protein